VKARDIERRIEHLGGQLLRQRGSHRRWVARTTLGDGREMVAYTVVPKHPGDVPTGTLRAIERDLEPVFGRGWLK